MDEVVGRRRFLASAATAGFSLWSGCLGTNGVSEEGRRDFPKNPVARNLGERPTRGLPRAETDITLVTFVDPSCPSCSSYHDGTFEKIESRWVDEGRATVINRLYPYVAPWGETAIHALVEVHRQEPDRFWSLKSSYYAHQSDLSGDNVIDMTRTFLSGSDVDIEAVVRAARSSTHESYVSTEVSDGDGAGLYGVPLTFLFENGEFVTTLMGEGFDTFASAVESDA